MHVWITEMFDEKIADKFLAEEVNGATLLSTSILNKDTMRELGLGTIGKRSRFEERLKELHAESKLS